VTNLKDMRDMNHHNVVLAIQSLQDLC